ncbi:hypothetical protein [Paraburkholderia oxyphila]|nr:hypothetical protein [Paraburkholderia oxyphila]
MKAYVGNSPRNAAPKEAGLLARPEEFIGYIENNLRFIVNYG